MVKIFEVQQQEDDISNYQSRIVEYPSFHEYLQNVNEKSLPRKYEIINKKLVNYEEQTVTFKFLYGFNNSKIWFGFVHFAKVIG